MAKRGGEGPRFLGERKRVRDVETHMAQNTTLTDDNLQHLELVSVVVVIFYKTCVVRLEQLSRYTADYLDPVYVV